MAATPNNNFNILPWYTSLEKLNSKKWYAFGQTWPLICPNDSILPFQFVVPGVITSVSTITLITPDFVIKTSVQPVIIANEKAGYSVIMVHPGITSLGTTLKVGQYRAQLVIGLDIFYSEIFTVVDNISDYIKLTYWNDENLYYNGGEVNYSNNFKYTMYICSTIGKPEYEFEEELTKRAGYKFLESQTSNKIYKFNFVAPEFICDAMRLIRLSDYIKLEYDGDSYNALSFSYEPKWETQGDLASVDVEFDTDAIIQKLVSFNRRQKEGFYNALLTNIDEPLLFDVNTVALYYDEYRAKAAAEIRDGKMIRDLSEISLVNENTLIVVDTGSGPAYKMSLYRLMEKFMRRDKDETTEFDFWVKGDAKFGRDNYDNPTASISRDGLFRTVSAIIYDYLSSEKFISGFAGEGFKIYKDEFGNWRIECDILDVRKVMNVFELIIQKIRSVNGALVISQANGKVSAVTESPDLQSWILEFEDKDETFQAHDLVRCQVFDRRTKQAPAFDFTKFASYLYDGTQIDDSVSITNMGVEFNLNNSANSGFQLYLRPADHNEQTPITTKECILEVSGLYEGMIAIWNALDKEEIGMEGIGGFLVNGENTIRAITEADNAYNLGIMAIADAGHGDGKVTIKQKIVGSNLILPLKIDAFKACNSDTSGVEPVDNYILTEESIQIKRKNGYTGLYLSNELPLEDGMTSQKIVTMPSIKIKVENKLDLDTVQFIALRKGGDVLQAIEAENGIVALPEIKESDECTFYAFNVIYASEDTTSPGVKITIQKVEDTASKKGKYYWCEVASVNGNLVTIPKSEFEGIMPAVGDEVVQMGNTENPLRQSLIYMSAAEDGKPKIELVGGVKTKSLTGTSRSVFGNLDHITDPSFPDNMQPHGEGVYTDNGYFKGAFVFFNGKNAQTEIEKAQTDASNAQAEAEAAKERLNKWASDGFISPSEKQQLLLEKRAITAEKSEINADANRYNVNTTSYNSAYEAYVSQINQHTATEPENIPVGPNLIPCQIDYYNNRTLILNEIAKAVKAKTDYLETEVSAIPGKITLAVRSLKVADVNLLKGAYKELKNDSYAIGYYPYDVPVINGKEYTLTVCYTLPANNTYIEAYANEGTNFLANFTTKGDKVIESKKVTMAGYKPTEGLLFYQLPSGTYGSKVHWAVLTDGNLGVTSWIPSASEKNVGLRNLCSFKRITDAGFTYLENYEDDGSFYVRPGILHEETNLANKDMFGLTYDPQKQYYIFIDSAIRSDTNLDKSSTFFIIKYTDGTEQSVCIVYPNKIEYNYIITQKPISKIVGSYGNGYVATLRIGVYETNFPVSWSPAPEDQLYQSVKYTDTQILAVDGKIELSVTTKVNQIGVGGDNLVRYYSDTLISYYLYSSTPIVKDGYAFETTWSSSNTPGVLAVTNQRIGQGEIPNFCYRFRMLINGVPATEDRIADKRLTTYAASGEMYYDGDGNFYGFVKGNTSGWFIHVPTTGMKGGDVIRIENFIVSNGAVCPGFSPASADISFLNEKFTQSKIDIVEGKITSTVEQINAVDGKVTGLASRVTQTESSINSVVGDINTLNNTTERKVTKRIDLTGWDNNKFYPLVIGLYQTRKNKVTINRPLDGDYGTPSYGTHAGGFSMNLTFEMSGSGWGSSPVIINIFDYYKAWTAAGAKIVVDLSQLTNSSDCVMGIRGGSKYDVTIYGMTDPNDINVFNADYTSQYGQVYPVRTDGTEPVRTYGYYTEIKQLENEISLKATKTEVTNSINSLSGRIEAAEIKLRPDNIALTVKEQGIGYSGTNYFGWGGGMRRDITGTGVYVTENKGTYGLQIACVNVSANILARYLGLGMNFKGPGKYTLSFKARQQAGVAMDLNINVCDAENFIITPPTTWQYYKKTFTVTQYTGDPYYGFIDFERSGGNVTQIIEFAEIMLEYGSEATQWRPAPFDTTAASGLLATGINISNSQIVLTADKTKFQNNSGSQIAVFDSNGINADLINAKKLSTAIAGKRIVVDPEAQEIQLYNENGNKVAAIGFKQDDRISIPYIQLKDYSYTGSVLRAFDIYGGTLYSNETRYGANYGYTLSPTTGLQFTKNGSVTKSYPAQ